MEGDRTRARGAILDVVRRTTVLDQDGAHPAGPSATVIVAQVRSIALNLLQATGQDRAQAQRALRDPR